MVRFKDWLKQIDDGFQRKTRRKMNKKSHKKRVYGLDWGPGGTGGSVNLSGAGGSDGGMAGEGLEMRDNVLLNELLNAAMPRGFTSNVLSAVQVMKPTHPGKRPYEPDQETGNADRDKFGNPFKYDDECEECGEEDDADWMYDEELEDFGWKRFVSFQRMDDEDFDDEDEFGKYASQYEPIDGEDWEEEQEQTMGMAQGAPGAAVGARRGPGGDVRNKIDIARSLFRSLAAQPDVTRKQIIQAFMDQVGVTQSTAVSYYERLAKEAGMTGDQGEAPGMGAGGMGAGDLAPGAGTGEQSPPEEEISIEPETEWEDPDRAGVIRTVDNAHLVYKRQQPEGTFEELWVFNTSRNVKDELTIRRDILAGTDIPPHKTRSEDGSQEFTLTTLGNAQMVHITGLPN